MYVCAYKYTIHKEVRTTISVNIFIYVLWTKKNKKKNKKELNNDARTYDNSVLTAFHVR